MLISITTSKGGSGKTTITALAGTNLFHYKKLKIALIDLDPQNSLADVRIDEIQELKNAAKQSKIFRDASENMKKNKKPFCDIHKVDLFQDFDDLMEKIREVEKEYDLVFLDFPGSFELHINPLYLLEELDYIFIPIYVDKNSFNSSFKFAQGIDQLKKEGKIKGKYITFFNKYNGVNGKNGIYFQEAEEALNHFGFPKMKNSVYDTISYERYSTIKINKWTPSPKNIHSWLDEVLNIIKI